MPAPDSFATSKGAADRSEELAWDALLTVARWTRSGRAPETARTFTANPAGGLIPAANDSPAALLERHPMLGWTAAAQAPQSARALFDLYLPVCNASAHAPLTVAHLGQSLDGYIATASGDSDYVNGPENLLHLHRMRALCDAVLVGAETIASDNPRLTVRRVPGDNPLRVVLDPQRRLASTQGVFRDGDAATLLVCDEARVRGSSDRVGSAEVLGIPTTERGLNLDVLLERLHARQRYAIFVEGGGRTVSAFLGQNLLDRLQIAIAPLITGAGRPGIYLTAQTRIADCPRLRHRVYAMGKDVLFDCDLRGDTAPSASVQPATDLLRRIL